MGWFKEKILKPIVAMTGGYILSTALGPWGGLAALVGLGIIDEEEQFIPAGIGVMSIGWALGMKPWQAIAGMAAVGMIGPAPLVPIPGGPQMPLFPIPCTTARLAPQTRRKGPGPAVPQHIIDHVRRLTPEFESPRLS